MVKNSKYILSIALWLIGLQLSAQGFDAIERDMEITRITLENYLKKWDGEMLLNRIDKSEAVREEGKGVTFKIEAPNARVYMNTRGGFFSNQDVEVMDTFYTPEIVSLQQDRLANAIKKFMIEYYSYLPKLNAGESFSISIDVKDDEYKYDKEEHKPSQNKDVRTYRLEVSVPMKDLMDLKKGTLTETEFGRRIKIDKK